MTNPQRPANHQHIVSTATRAEAEKLVRLHFKNAVIEEVDGHFEVWVIHE